MEKGGFKQIEQWAVTKGKKVLMQSHCLEKRK
jgi:hypothetical protein